MWKILLGFSLHRLVLLVVALGSVNYSINQKYPSNSKFPRIGNTSVLLAKFGERLKGNSEFSTLERHSQVAVGRVFIESGRPFYWIARCWLEISPMGIVSTMLFVSNVFFLLFLFETHILLTRFVMLDTALWGVLILMLFPYSYEVSLGSTLSLTLYLSAVALRRALDNQWIFTGISMGLIALDDWIVLGWLPLLVFLFWYYQKQVPLIIVLKRTIFFTLPIVVAMIYRWEWYSHALTSMGSSALVSLFRDPSQWLGGIESWKQLAQAAPIISLLLFILGTILCLVSHMTWLSRIIPAYCVIAVMLFSNVQTISVRLTIAGVALVGIAHVSSGPLAQIISALLTLVSCVNIVRIFSGA